MKRVLLWLLLSTGLFTTGCVRDPDPLAWKIEGHHFGDLQASVDHISKSLPPGLDREFAFCLNNIVASVRSDGSGTPEEQANRICRRIRDKSVRDILIEGNTIARQAILSRFSQETGYLLRVLEQSDLYSDAQRQVLPGRIEVMQTRIAWLKDALAKSNRRITELYTSAARS